MPAGRIRVSEVYALLTAHSNAYSAASDTERAEIWSPPAPEATGAASSASKAQPSRSQAAQSKQETQSQSHFDVARFASERGIARAKLDALAQHYSVLSVVRPVEMTPAGKVPPLSLGAISPKLDFKLVELALAGKRDEIRAMMAQAELDESEKREVIRILSTIFPRSLCLWCSFVQFYATRSLHMSCHSSKHSLIVWILVHVQMKWLAPATSPSSRNG